VEEVHDLHVWSLTPGIALLCAHVSLTTLAEPSGVLSAMTHYCRSLGIEHSTFQLVVDGVACPCSGVDA
jgi:Co/Zn/Cd efflux system component